MTGFQQTTATGPSQVNGFQQTTGRGPSQVTGFQQTTGPGPSRVTGFQQTTAAGPSQVNGFQQTTGQGPSQVTGFQQTTGPGPSQVTEFQQTSFLPDRNNLLSALQTQECQTILLNGTVGMVTAMQGAITSLQATVNNLLQKETQSTHQNSLETFYNSDARNSTATVPNIFQHGIPADDLPHIDVASESLKKSIVSGKCVNLAALLVPDNDAFKSTESIVGLELLKQQQRDHRLDRVLSITQFYKAFGIYKHVMCEAFPQHRNELDLYEADIGEIFNHCGEIFLSISCSIHQKSCSIYGEGHKGRLVKTS